MKTNRHHIILIVLAFIISSCSVDTIRVSANDTIITKEINASNYSAIEIANSFNAYVAFSDTEGDSLIYLTKLKIALLSQNQAYELVHLHRKKYRIRHQVPKHNFQLQSLLRCLCSGSVARHWAGERRHAVPPLSHR